MIMFRDTREILGLLALILGFLIVMYAVAMTSSTPMPSVPPALLPTPWAS